MNKGAFCHNRYGETRQEVRDRIRVLESYVANLVAERTNRLRRIQNYNRQIDELTRQLKLE